MLKANLKRCVLIFFKSVSETLRKCGGGVFHRAGLVKESAHCSNSYTTMVWHSWRSQKMIADKDVCL